MRESWQEDRLGIISQMLSSGRCGPKFGADISDFLATIVRILCQWFREKDREPRPSGKARSKGGGVTEGTVIHFHLRSFKAFTYSSKVHAKHFRMSEHDSKHIILKSFLTPASL